jgi:tetratricopeptide (TPR) repeat protein
MEQKRYNEAINTLEHAIQLTPQSDEAMFYLAVAYSLRGNATKSIALYERLSVTNPDNTIVAVNLGFAYFDDGQLEKAEQNFNRAIALSPDNNLAHYGLGLVYKFSGAFEKSRRQFSLFLNSEPPQSYWARQARKNLSELEHYR